MVLDILNLEPEVKEEIEMMHGQKIRPIKFIVIKIIELLNFMLKIEGIQNLENLVCKSNVFSTLWVILSISLILYFLSLIYLIFFKKKHSSIIRI